MANLKSLPRPTTPYFWRMLKFIFRPLDYLEGYAQEYGDIFAVGSEDYPFVYLNHPQGIEEVFTAPPEQFESGRGNRVLGFILGANSLVLLDGEGHRQQRKLLMPPFHGERLKTYAQLIQDITQKVTQNWTVSQSFQLRPLMQKITLGVILQAVFGLEEGERYHQLKILLTQLLDSIGSPLSSTMLFFPSLRKDWGNWTPWGKFLRLKQEIDQLLETEIQQRREQQNFTGEDILTLLMVARDENGHGMSNIELRDELMTLLVAGHETTASALCWAFYWIHFLPEVQTKIRAELSGAEDISRLPYLNAVCLETLRIYPITLTTFPRITKIPLEIMGYSIPVGAVLSPCIYLVHHREEIYPEADKFKPERFLERQYSPYEYFPFGGGNRRCLGMALAMLEMKIVIATILSEFQLDLVAPGPLKPVRRGFTLAPPSQLKFIVRNWGE